MAGNANYTTALLSATINQFLTKEVKDTIFQGIPFFDEMHKKHKVMRKGSTLLFEGLRYAKSTSGGAYSGWDTFDLTPQEGLTRAEFAWKYYEWTLMINGQEMNENAGTAQAIDLLQFKWDQAKDSIRDQLAQDIFLAGTAGNAKGIVGLELAVDSAGTYANIVRSTNTWWSANETAVSGPLVLAGLNGMRRMYNSCAYGQATMTPDLLITTQLEFEAYEALMDPYLRFTVQSDNPAILSENLKFRKAPLYWDGYCQSGYMYFLNTEFLKFVIANDRDFNPGDWKEPANQDGKVAQIYFAGNITLSNCRRNGKLTGLNDA